MNSKERRIRKIEDALKVNDDIMVPIYTAVRLGCKGRMSKEEFDELPQETRDEIIRCKKLGIDPL